MLPVAAIEAGANLTQMTDAAKAKTAITIAIGAAEAPKQDIRQNKTVGGSEPQVPGATGSHPRPKHDRSSLFIVFLKVN